MPPGRRTNKSDSRAQINEFNYYTDPGSNRILSDPGRDSDMSLRDDVEENQMNRYSSQQYSVIEIPVTFPQAISPEASYNTQSSSQGPTRDNVQQHSFPLDVRDDSGEFMEIYSENRYQDNYSFAPSDFNFDSNQQQFNTSQELHIGVNQQDRCYQPSEVQFLSQQQTHYESQQHMESIIQQMSNQSISQPHPGEQQPQGSMVLPSSISQQRIRGSRRSLISSRMTTEQQLGIQQRHKRPSHHQINQQQQFVVGRQCSSMHPSMQNRTQQQENEQLQFQQMQMQIRLSSPIGSSYASPVQDQTQISTSSVHQSNQINRGFVYPGNSSSCCLSSESGPSRGHNREIPISHPSQCVYINYNQNPRLGYLYGSDHSNSSLNSSNHHRPSSIQSSHTQRSPISPFRLVTSPIQPIRSEEDSQFASPRAASSSMEWQRMIVQRNNICTRASIENQNGQQFLIHHQSSNYNQQYQPPHPQQIHDEVAGQIPVQCLSEEVIQQDFQSRAITPIPVLSFEVIDETFGQIQIEQLTHQSIESPISDSLEQLIHDEIDQRVQELHAQDIRRNEFQQATSDAAAVSNFEPSTIFPIEEPYGVHEFSSSEDSPVPSVMPQPAPEFEKVNIPLAPMRRNLSRSSLKDYAQPRQLPKWIEKSRPIPQKSRNSKALSALLKDREGAERLVATAQSVYPSTTVMARHGISRDYTTPRYFPKEAQKTTTPTLKSDFSQTRSQPRHFKSIQHLSSSSSVSKPVSQPSNFSLISPSKKMDSQLSVNKKPDSKTTTVKPTRPNPSLTANNSCGLSLEDIMGGMVFPSTPFEEIKKVMEAREAADRARVMKSEVARKEGRRSTETLEMTEVRKSKEFPKAKEIGRSVGVVKEKEIRPLLSPFKSYDTKKSVEASIPKTKSSEFDYKSVQSSISQSSELSSDKSDIPVPGPPPTMITSKDVQGNKDRSVHEVPFVNDSPGTSISNPTRRHSDNLLFGPPIKRPCSLIDNDEPNIFTEEDPFGFMASPVRTGEITLSEFIAFSAECDSSAEIIPLDMSLCSSTKIAENFRKPIDVNSEEKEINFTFPKNFYRELGSSDRYRSSRENQTTDPGTNVNHLFRDSKRTTKLNIGYEQELEKFSRFYETAVACTDGDIFKETYVGIASLSDFLQLTKVAVRWLKVRQVPILPFEDNIDEFEGLLPKPLRMFVSNEFPTKNVHEVVYGYSKFSRLELSALLSCYFLFEEIDQNPMISMNIAKFKFYTAKWRIVLRNRIEKNQYVHPLFVIWASATWETDRPFALIEFTRNIFKEEFKELEEAKKRLNPKMFQKRAFDVFIRKAKDMSGDLDSREIPFIVAAGRILNQMFQIQNPIEACKITRRLSYCLLKFRNSLSKKIKGYHLRKEDEEFWFSFFKGLYSEENGSKNNRKLKSKINELLENDHLDEEEEKILIIKFFNLIIGEIFPGITPPDIKDDLTLRNNGYIAYVIYLSNEVLKAWLQYYKFQEKTKSTDLTVFEEKFVFYDTFNPIAFKSDCLPEYQKFFEFRFLPKIDAVLSHLELEQLDSIMEILEIVSDKENGLDKKKREDRGNESEGTKGQKETSQVSREIYNSYISGKKIPEHSALAHLSLAQGEVKKKTIISKSLLSLVPKVLSNSSFQSKKKSKFIKNRESQEEIPLCAICDGKQTIIYNTPLSEMESFVESIKKGRKLENTVMLNTIWNKTRELNRDWVLNGRVIYQQSRALECVLDINNNDEPEGPDSRNNKLLNVVGSIIPYDIKETHILMKLCRYYFHSSCFDTAEQKFSFFLEEAVGNPFAI
ncbi:hypothetical protein FO519_005020 [Halicephalobus sp. NKZ332]|nr:hypothetical protein FO519_005020 [Halicephalobus sp. NKZ332]